MKNRIRFFPFIICWSIIGASMITEIQMVAADENIRGAEIVSSLTNGTYIELVDGLDIYLSFGPDTPSEKIAGFKKLINITIPEIGDEISPYLYDKIMRSQDPRVVSYAIMALINVKKHSEEEIHDLETKMKEVFPNYPSDLSTEKGRSNLVTFLKEYFATK